MDEEIRVKHGSIVLLTLTLLSAATPAVIAQQRLTAVRGRTYVLTADGAGGLSTLAENLGDVYSEMLHLGCRRPIIRSISWANGNNIEDYRSREYHQAGAATMVRQVQRIRQASPNSRIVLIGYSAGGCVVALAAEQLPPASVDRIILLAPTVPSNQDVRPILRASKLGVDVFYVPDDQFIDLLQNVLGAPYDEAGSTVAATTGFRPPASQPTGAGPTLGKLRQYPLPGLRWEHFGTAQPDFLRAYVVPLIP